MTLPGGVFASLLLQWTNFFSETPLVRNRKRNEKMHKRLYPMGEWWQSMLCSFAFLKHLLELWAQFKRVSQKIKAWKFRYNLFIFLVEGFYKTKLPPPAGGVGLLGRFGRKLHQQSTIGNNFVSQRVFRKFATAPPPIKKPLTILKLLRVAFRGADRTRTGVQTNSP